MLNSTVLDVADRYATQVVLNPKAPMHALKRTFATQTLPILDTYIHHDIILCMSQPQLLSSP